MVAVDRSVLHKGLASSRQALLRPTADPLRGLITSNGLRLVQEGYLSVWDDIPLESSNGSVGEFSVNGADLYSIVSATSADTVELKINEKSLGVRYGKSNLRIPFVSTFGEIPDLPSVTNAVNLPATFMSALSETPKFLARTEDKPSLSCVYVRHEGNNVFMFATNSIIMYFSSFEVEESGDMEYLIPVQTVESVSKVFGKKEVQLGITDREHIYISNGSTSTVTPGFNGVYPVVALDLAKNVGTPMFTTSKKELVRLLRLGMDVSEGTRVAIAQEDSNVKLTFHETRLDADLYLESVVNVSQFGSINFNPRFLLSCLSPMGDEVMFNENSSGAIRITDGKTVSILYKLLVY